MADLETIVRPFETRSVSPAQQQEIGADQPSNPPLFLAFGKSGVGKIFSISYSSRVVRYLDQQVVEKSS